jgi:hypothetical protein
MALWYKDMKYLLPVFNDLSFFADSGGPSDCLKEGIY